MNFTYLWHFLVLIIHRKNICRPKSCDFLDLRRGSPITASFWNVFLPLIWCRGQGPSWELGFYQLPSFSTTIEECKREWPVKNKTKNLLIVSENIWGYESWEPGFYQLPIISTAIEDWKENGVSKTEKVVILWTKCLRIVILVSVMNH